MQKNEIKRKTNVLYKKAYEIAHLRPRVSQERWAWRDATDAAGCPGQTGQSCFAPPTLLVASKLQTNHNTTPLVNNECHKQTGNPMRMLSPSLSATPFYCFEINVTIYLYITFTVLISRPYIGLTVLMFSSEVLNLLKV